MAVSLTLYLKTSGLVEAVRQVERVEKRRMEIEMEMEMRMKAKGLQRLYQRKNGGFQNVNGHR
ncbi:hypothetical protein [Paenibacillus sp. TH7-28]